jgi:hypothetical protein
MLLCFSSFVKKTASFFKGKNGKKQIQKSEKYEKTLEQKKKNMKEQRKRK